MIRKPAGSLIAALIMFAAMVCPSYGQADTETILHTFIDGNDGALPVGIAFDGRGNVYGTVELGGGGPCTFPGQGCGLVFEATPTRDASGSIIFEKKIIHVFQGGSEDGATPSAPLVLGPNGELYGTTANGGGTECVVGCGTVFELQRAGDQWTETSLYNFTGGVDGGTPESSVILDGSGNIYGTTFNGGLDDCALHGPCGVVYELQHTDSGWVETVLHEFDYKDGEQPFGGLVMDKSGNLYGTTPWGGSPHLYPFEPAGTIYELSPTRSGWTFEVLYRFPAGGGQSFAGLTLDAEGNLYGTANAGGIYGLGSVFELQRPTAPDPSWAFSTLYSFDYWNGSGPSAGVIFDRAGNLYGTASGGGTGGANCAAPCGVVYELSPSDGGWTETVLYNFQGGTDGASPDTTPIFDPWGNLYGAAAYGGDPNCVALDYSGCGTIYRINHASPQE